MLGPVDLNGEAIGMLRQCLDRDPMIGFAVPRLRCASRCCIARLARHGLGGTEWLPRKTLADLPETQLFAEIAAPCMLIGPQILANFGPLEEEFESLGPAMLAYMAAARRCGFRTVVSNRAIVGMDGLGCDVATVQPLPAPTPTDHASLCRHVPDLERTWLEFRAGSWERYEKLRATAVATAEAAPTYSLLLDARNVGPIYNGTSQAILGTLSAIRELDSGWDVAILATPEGAAFHGLHGAYPDWPIYTALPDRLFTFALRPSQPWHIQEMVDLHNVALLNAYLVLDTIAWDIAFAAPPHLDGVWQFLVDHADALLFDSEFTRRRFFERFPARSPMPNLVTLFSLDPSEYRRTPVMSASTEEEFILVVGNSLDHKDVRRTVDVLTSAFPFRRIRALGPANAVSPMVTAHHSGALPDLDMHRLYASAQFVVFPSFYEGFGFPILTALAYGRTVLARRSALLEEVAAHCVRRGRLVAFERREELAELVGQLVHGEPVPEHPLGTALTNGRPRGWKNVAQDIFAFLQALVRDSGHSRWLARERTVRQLLAYRH
jgi:glycosyltransferase involved in cell wall biosynthesis